MRILVTGGAGFIGTALVERLLAEGHEVRVLDSNFRSSSIGLTDRVLFFTSDIRILENVLSAADGCDEIIHAAYINGTKYFYEMPDRVLDVAVRGMTNVLLVCKRYSIKRLMLLSSSEVCRAQVGDMNETVPLVIPDPFNPRYSYSAGKIISEMLAIHSGLFDWLTIIRPFNIYGPHMREGHVIPDFKQKLDSFKEAPNSAPEFHILGSKDETRSFCYIDDLIDGLMLVRDKGEHKGIYNIGTEEEITINALAKKMGVMYGMNLTVHGGDALREGSIERRRPDISKMRELGYTPKVSLDEGLRRVLCQ